MILTLTDENFDKEVQAADRPILIDFFADWCQPCVMLAPVLDKVAKEFEGKLIFAKANLNDIPLTAQKFGIEQIPTVALFDKGKPVSGFVGLRPEEAIREWLGNILNEDKRLDEFIEGYAGYAKQNGFRLNPDGEAVKRVVKGLFENERKYGKKYCPCRRVTGNPEEDRKIICPCAYHKEEIEKDGHCTCHLFYK